MHMQCPAAGPKTPPEIVAIGERAKRSSALAAQGCLFTYGSAAAFNLGEPSGTKREMHFLYESWCSGSEDWKKTTIWLRISSKSGSRHLGVKRWMTRLQMENLLGSDVASAITEAKESDPVLKNTECRYHPDAPGVEAAGLSDLV